MIASDDVRRALGFALLAGLAASAWGCAPADDANAAADDAAAADEAPAAAAQEMEAMKAYLIDGFERAKAWDLSMAEAMPDSAMDWAPTPGVRDFAAQIVHSANNGFIGNALFGEEGPTMDEDVTDRQTLVSGITNGYDWILERLNAMPASELTVEVEVFGQTMPRWRAGTFALEHAMWTRGQLVPYLHAHGVEVPQQRLF